MNAENITKLGRLTIRILICGAMPALILSIWGHHIFWDVYGVASIDLLLLVPIEIICAISFIVSAILLAFLRNKKSAKNLSYWLAMLLLSAGLPFLSKYAVLLGMNWRIHHETLFAECREKAQKVEGHGHFNVCESHDMSGLAFTAQVFRDVIYDSSDTKIFFSPLRPKISGAFSSNAYSDQMTARRITGHYYFVYGSFTNM